MVTRAIAVAATLAAFAAPDLAAASSCDGPDLASFVAPAPGTGDVPTNSKIWVADDFFFLPDLVLLGPDGRELAYTVEFREYLSVAEPWARQELQILTPESPLAPDADHAVWGCDGDQCTALLSTFHTGPGPSSTPPAVPTVVSTTPGRACDFYWLDMVVDFDGAVLVVDTVDGSHDDPNGSGLAVSGARELFTPWPTRTDDAELRIGAFAPDGSFSGWSDPIAVHHDLGCAIGDAPPAALLLLLLGLRRRRAAR